MSEKRNIGAMRFLVRVFQPGRTSDGAGGSVRTDTNLGDAMASIRPANASDIFRAQRLSLEVSHVIVMRQTVNMGQNYVLTCDGVTYRVARFYDEDNRKRFWTIWAVTGGPT